MLKHVDFRDVTFRFACGGAYGNYLNSLIKKYEKDLVSKCDSIKEKGTGSLIEDYGTTVIFTKEILQEKFFIIDYYEFFH